MASFQFYMGIDYSGAGLPTDRQPGIQVFCADATGTAHQPLPGEDGWNWNRTELAAFLAAVLEHDAPTIVGIDHAFALPKSYLTANGLETWDDMLAYLVDVCPAHAATVEQHRANLVPAGPEHELRLTETWTGGARSVFDFGPNGVAKSTFAGLPWLRVLRNHLGDRVHWWPFDGWQPPAGKSVVCEVYPALFSRRYPAPAGSTPHARDAHAVAAWLQDWDTRGRLAHYFHPPLSDAECEQARLEGWIFGIC